MAAEKKPTTLTRKLLSVLLLIIGTRSAALSIACLVSAIVNRAKSLATGGSLTFAFNRDGDPFLFLMLLGFIAIGIGCVWGSAVLWQKWPIALGVLLTLLGVEYLVSPPDLALVTVSRLIAGVLLVAGVALIVYERYIAKRTR